MDKERSGEQLPKTDTHLIEVNPAALMQDNPAALIVNQTMYQRILAGGFNPIRCGEPQVARVKTYSPEHDEAIRLFVIDGLTRTKFVNDHLDEIQCKHPGWRFQVEDMTEEVIKDTTIVLPHERREGYQELTMVQYLRAIVEPTKAHAQIAPGRIAAHLINGWEVIVGQELAEKFSATAALSFLTETTINENMLRGELRDRKLVVGIDDEAGERLRQALVDMASVIRGAGLDQREVTKSAFLLLGTLSPVIGGERRTREEIYGLLYGPEVERKLLQAFPDNKADRAMMRAQLDKILQQLIKNYASKRDGVIIIRETLKALKDENLEFHHFRDIVMSDNPDKRYEQITRQINQDRFTHVYLRTLDKAALTGFELVLIEQLGGGLTDAKDILKAVSAIYEASNVLQQVVDFRNQLTDQRGELLKSGVSVKLLDEAVASINNLQAGLLAAQSIQAVSSRTDAIIKEIVKTRKDISTQQRVHTITSRIDEISGEDLRTAFGNLKRAQLIAWIFREFGNADEVIESEVSHKLEQLKQLRSEFQREVVETGMRIEVALQRQKERRIIQPATEERKIEEETVPSRPVESKTVVEPQPALPDDVFTLPIESADAFRRRVNVERLAQVSDLALRVFGMLDLDINEVPRQEVEKLDRAFRMWSRFRYKHPDVDRLVTEALSEQQKRIRLLEDEIALDREQTDRDTRTGR